MPKPTVKQIVFIAAAVVLVAVGVYIGIPALQSKIAENAEQEKLSHGIQHLGQICEFTLPPNWRFTGKDEQARSYAYGWESCSEPVAYICIYAPPDFIPGLSADVMQVLDRAEHRLTAEELHLLGVEELIRNNYRAGSFDIANARTIDVDGHKVLRFERKSKPPDQDRDDVLVINADGNGKCFQYISYSGRGAAYDIHHDEAENAFKSLRLDLSYMR